MRIQESRIETGGFLGRRVQVRVRDLAEGETKPENATEVSPDAPVYDWKNEEPKP